MRDDTSSAQRGTDTPQHPDEWKDWPMADIELNEDPRSTWGASEAYKRAWHEQYGKKAPSRSAAKAEWVKWATDPVHGDSALSEDDAEAMTRDELADQFGGEVDGLYSAPSAPNSPATSPQGSGTGPEGNQANDPAKQTATTGTTRGTATR